jgi:hypothetical protein
MSSCVHRYGLFIRYIDFWKVFRSLCTIRALEYNYEKKYYYFLLSIVVLQRHSPESDIEEEEYPEIHNLPHNPDYIEIFTIFRPQSIQLKQVKGTQE